MEDTCEGTDEQKSKFATLNGTLQNISGELRDTTKAIAGHLDRLVGVATESPKGETPVTSSLPGLIGALENRVEVLGRRVTELHEQLSRIDGKF